MNYHNLTVGTFSQTPFMPNTQRYNENTILTIEKRNNSDALSETLKGLTINNAVYYESESENMNDTKSILQEIQR